MTQSTINFEISFEHFDSVAMNMAQAFNQLVSIAAKADTPDALLAIKEQLDSMSVQLDSAIDSHFDASIEESIEDESTTPVDSANQVDTVTDSDDDTRKPFDSEAVAYIKKQLTRLNIITKSIAEGKDGVKRMRKEIKLEFIEQTFNHYEMLAKFVADSYKDSDLLETANFQSYVQSKQQILTTCYDNVAIGE